jgi:CheY-like chemotaxis protein
MPEKLSPTLLLIDNNAEFAYLIDRYTKTSGWKMAWAQALSTAQETLAAGCGPQGVNLVLLNVLIQPDTGWQFLSTLKSHPHYRKIPVAVYSSVPDEARAEREGADFYLWQPILYPDFARLLDEVLLLQ